VETLETTPTGQNSPSCAVLTDVGRVRERNEDLAAADLQKGVYILADGMGGHPDGNLASQIAVDTAMAYVTKKQVPGRPRDRGDKLAAAIVAANRAILERSTAPEGTAGMGTTIVCLWLGKRWVHIAHVGDSRIYRFRDGEIEQLTRDHTVVQALLDRGEIDPDAPEFMQLGHILTQAVGLDPAMTPVVARLPARTGDVYLLCSDGLTDLVRDSAIAAILGAKGADPHAAAEALIAAALSAGGNDNITVIVARDDLPRQSRVTAKPKD